MKPQSLLAGSPSPPLHKSRTVYTTNRFPVHAISVSFKNIITVPIEIISVRISDSKEMLLGVEEARMKNLVMALCGFHNIAQGTQTRKNTAVFKTGVNNFTLFMLPSS
jgi:hypothetical protein